MCNTFENLYMFAFNSDHRNQSPTGDTFSATCQEPKAAHLKPFPYKKCILEKYVGSRRKTKDRYFRNQYIWNFKSPKSNNGTAVISAKESSNQTQNQVDFENDDLNDFNDFNDFIATSLMLL